MRVVVLVTGICAVIVGVGVAAAYALHASWPIAGAGLLDVVLFSLFNVGDRFHRAVEAAQDD